jgi:uncharacterized DUF497 family protein
MLELDEMEGFEWDDGNARKSVDKHGVSQAEAEQVFFNIPLLLRDDKRHSTTEVRAKQMGAACCT